MVSRTPTLVAGSASAVWAAALVLAAVIPLNDGPGISVPDWLAHGAGYGIQAGLLWILLRSRRWGRGPGITAATAGAIALGAATELLQTLCPPRTAEWSDLGADALGAVLVVAVLEAGSWMARRQLGGHAR